MSELHGMPMPLGPQMPPQMQINPAFLQWMQVKQAWDDETQKRQQQFMAACQLLSEDAAKSYKIDIEADSTVAADEAEEKKSRTEFMQAVTPFMEAMIPLAQMTPALAPLVSELLLFTVRGFKVSRSLEDAFETALQALQRMPPPPPQQKGNTKSPMEIQSEAQIEAGKQQNERMEIQQGGQIEAGKQQNARMEMQQDGQEAAAKLQIAQQQNAVKMQQIQAQAAIEAAKLQAQQSKDAVDMAMRSREMEGREALERARIDRMAARSTEGLV